MQVRIIIMLLYHYRENFGDNLAPYIVSSIIPSEYLYWAKPFRFGRFSADVARFVYYSFMRDYRTSDLLAYELNKKILISVGSIIEEANSNSIVWGAGISHKDSYICKKADIRAVRGYKTLERMSCIGIKTDGIAVGDPAILLPNFFKPDVPKKRKIGIIPHKNNFTEITERLKGVNSDEIVVISLINKDIEAIIREILSCEIVVSTSLHGLIVAHAYSIPALWIESSPILGDRSKFFDYFSSLGIKEYLPKKFDIIETLLRHNNIPDIFDLVYSRGKGAPERKLESIRKSLIEAFPFDIV